MIAERITDTHIYFWNGIFSQWYTTKDQFNDSDRVYQNAEQYMMYHKAILFQDYKIANDIMLTSIPGDIKALGKKIKNFNLNIWNQHKENIVTQGNVLKFSQNETLKNIMFEYKKHILVEASPYDKIWGIGLAPNDDRVLNEKNWDGENLLGKCIMEARKKIK